MNQWQYALQKNFYWAFSNLKTQQNILSTTDSKIVNNTLNAMEATTDKMAKQNLRQNKDSKTFKAK